MFVHVPETQFVLNTHPFVFPFSKPPFVTQFVVHVGAQLIGVGVSVCVGQSVRVLVGLRVRVWLIVQVWLIVFVCQGVHVRESVGGQVIVRVGLCGKTQQSEISMWARQSVSAPQGS